MMQRLFDDVRHGARILTKSPGLSLTAALLVALVVGGNTTIYSMVNGVIRRPAPAVTATDLVSFGLVGRPGAPFFLYSDFTQYAEQTTSLRSLAAFGFSRAAVTVPAGTFLLQATPVTRNYFDTAGIRLARGRTFGADEDREGAPLVAVISDALWRNHFQMADDVVGRGIAFNGRPATIVGVAPPRFAGITMGDWTDVWVPLHAYGLQGADADVAMFGRLAPGSSIARVAAEFQTLKARLDAASPQVKRAPVLVMRYSASAGGVLPAFEREILAVFSIVTLLTLIVVGANVANLLLSRAVVRQRETAVRQSLGASRARLVRLIVVEGLVIAVIACAMALLIAAAAASAVPAFLPQGPAAMPVDFRPDWRVAVYAAILTVVGTVISGLVPALRTWKLDALPFLKDGAHTTVGGRSRASNALVVLQIAFSVLLLTAGMLAFRSWTLMNGNVGFDSTHMLLVNVGTNAAVPSPGENPLLLDRIRERLAAIPNVSAVTYTQAFWGRAAVRSAQSDDSVNVLTNVVGPEYLETLGLTTTRGRSVTPRDRVRGQAVAVINDHVARTLFPGADPIGQTLRVGERGRLVEIVGVVPDAHFNGFNPERDDQQPAYVLVSDMPVERVDNMPPTTFYLRYGGTLDAVSAAVPEALREVDSRVALASRETFSERQEQRALSARMVSMLLMMFASLSLLIAGVGQYAVIAFNTRRRTRDFGLRIALGASAGQIIAAVLGEGTRLTATGLAIGFALSVAVATLLRGTLFGVTPTDPPTYLAVFALLGCVSLLACYLPARRASRISPVQALRQD